MPTKLLATLAVVAVAGCAGGGQATPEVAGAEEMTVVVINEYVGAISTFAVWQGRRIRLGEVGANRTRTFSTPVNGDRLQLSVEAMGAPPGGTSAGPGGFSGGGGASSSAPRATSEAVPVVEGDRVEFRLSANGTLLYRRLPPS